MWKCGECDECANATMRMPDRGPMAFMQNQNIEFTRNHIDKVFKTLTSSDNELNQYFSDYLAVTYSDDLTEKLYYVDIAEISKFIVDKFKTGQIDFFSTFFSQVDIILTNCDTYIDELIVVGLFEGIQNICGLDIDYYFGFDKWLKPESKSKWDTLIDGWEGKTWRNRKQ